MPIDKHIRIEWFLCALMATALAGLLVWAMLAEIALNPTREAVADLGPYGLVTVRLDTTPYPALPTGTVTLSFRITDSRRRAIEPDAFSFEYGREGSDQPVGSGTAQPMSDGSGMLMGGVQLPTVGTWWLRVDLSKDGHQDDVRFTIEVRPAQ